MRILRGFSVVCLGLVSGCAPPANGPDGGGGDARNGLDVPPGTDAGPLPDAGAVTLLPGEFTYTLTEGTAGFPLWTTVPTHRVTRADAAPASRASGLALWSAKNEFEPGQLVLPPGSGSVTVSFPVINGLGATQRRTIARAKFVSNTAETLEPVADGGSVTLDPAASTVLWFTVYVPADATAGAHAGTITLTPSGSAALSIPVTVNVFNFALPAQRHFATQLDLSIASLIPAGGSVDDAKNLLWEHRLTPTSVSWPSGFNYNITWDTAASGSGRCTAFWDEPTEAPAYSVHSLSRRYILGEGWNGVGFPSANVLQFVNNSTPRPDTFCGLSRGATPDGTAAYNAAWSQYLTALRDYLVSAGMSDKAYYYVQNEPQNDEDHRVANLLCRLTRAAAPGLRIAISEEPTAAIAERPEGACGYDIWIAHIAAYAQDYAWNRQRNFHEQTWFYSLDQDAEPFFNPTEDDALGIEARVIAWAAYAKRLSGWAYYDPGRFFNGANPGLRFELLRESMEDYEYLWLANGGANPTAGDPSALDPTVGSVAPSFTGWTRDEEAFTALRRELGRYIEGARTTVPVLSRDTDLHPRAAYYLNFQDPNGAPAADPLVVDGKTWRKVGWQAYDAATGLGWYGANIGNSAIALYGYDDVAGATEVQKSYLYDDYGRDARFEFALANGRYLVTVGAGRVGRAYPTQPHNLSVEGAVVIHDEPTTDAMRTFTRATTVDLTDGSLSVEVAGRSQAIGDYSYTFLQYVMIEPMP